MWETAVLLSVFLMSFLFAYISFNLKDGNEHLRSIFYFLSLFMVVVGLATIMEIIGEGEVLYDMFTTVFTSFVWLTAFLVMLYLVEFFIGMADVIGKKKVRA